MVDLPEGVDWYPAADAGSGAEHGGRAGRPALAVVLPGGGYGMHAPHEGEGYTRWLNGIGIDAVVFAYPLAPHRHPDAVVATRALVRDLRTDRWAGLPSDPRIVVIGSSAGGHLAALVSNAPTPAERAVSDVDDRPDLTVLCYPVTSMTDHPHVGSTDNLLGPGASVRERSVVDADLLVDDRTPPTFLWHTAEDEHVPVTHSLSYAHALARHGVPFELHVFERGVHGIGLAGGLGPAEAWSTLATTWLRDRGW